MSRNDHIKLKNEKDIFKYYKCFDGEKIVSDKEIGKKYEQELIDILEEKEKIPLEKIIEKIEKTNPYENGYLERKNFNSIIKDRKKLKNQISKVNNPFSYIIDGKKKNSLETMIQRHIMLSDKYDEIIGKPIFYEFPCNTSNKETDNLKKGKIPIDLITYNKKEKILYLIELKKCNAIKNKNKISSNLTESNEMALRALLEITTYYSFFINNKNKENINKALNDVGKININLDEITIKKAILVPKKILENVYSKKLKKELNKINCFTIETIKNDISNEIVSSKEKIFNIEKWKYNE